MHPHLRHADGRAASQRGFAIASALVIAALALVSAAGLLAVTRSSLWLVGAESDALAAQAAAEDGVAAAAEALRWGWVSAGGTIEVPAVGEGRCSVTIEAAAPDQEPSASPSSAAGSSSSPPPLQAWRVVCTGRSGRAVRRLVVRLVSTPGALPRGALVDGDAFLFAPLDLECSGLYAGGDVSGREHVRFDSGAGSQSLGEAVVPDLAYGWLFGVAAVHARGVILRDGVEVHAPGGAAEELDDDLHTFGGPPAHLLAPLPAWQRAALAAHSCDAGAALSGDQLDVTLLRPAPGEGDGPAAPGSGHVVVIDRRGADGPLSVVGARDQVAGACPLTILVLGDCVLGAPSEPGSPVSFTGALVVDGRLSVAAPATVRGGVRASELVVHAPLRLVIDDRPGGFVQESAPGASNVHIGSWAESEAE